MKIIDLLSPNELDLLNKPSGDASLDGVNFMKCYDYCLLKFYF